MITTLQIYAQPQNVRLPHLPPVDGRRPPCSSTPIHPNTHIPLTHKKNTGLLDFRIPQGFYLSLGKSISSELKGCYTLGLPNVRSVGFLFSSVPFNCPKQRLTDEADLLGDRRWGEPDEEHIESLRKDGTMEQVLQVDDGLKGAETDIISKTPDGAKLALVPSGI